MIINLAFPLHVPFEMAPLAPLECEFVLLAIHLASLQLQTVLDMEFHNFLKNQRHSWLEFQLKYKEPPLNLGPGKVTIEG